MVGTCGERQLVTRRVQRGGALASEMTIRRRALATLASTPTRSNSIFEALREVTLTRRFAVNSARSQWFDSPGWWPGKAVPET